MLSFAIVIIAFSVSAASANDGALWIGIGEGALLGAEFHHALGPVGFAFRSGGKEVPSPDPSVSETPLREAETLLATFYEHEFGPLSAGVGVVHMSRNQTGSKTVVVDGAPQLVPVSVLRDTTTSLAAVVRAVFDVALVIGDAKVMVTSKGIIWSAKAGYEIDRFRFGVGYQAGPTDDWWSGPLMYVGASW